MLAGSPGLLRGARDILLARQRGEQSEAAVEQRLRAILRQLSLGKE